MLWTVCVVAFVVEDHERAAAVQIAQHPARKRVLALRAFGDDGIALPALVMFGFGGELMPIDDRHLAALQEWTQPHRNQIELLVVARGIVRTQDLQALLDGQIGADHQRRGREAFVAGQLPPVAERPGDEHRHYHGLAGASRHLASQSSQGRQALVLRDVDQPLEVLVRKSGGEARALAPHADFRKIYDRFHCLDLAEEQTAQQVFSPPMPQELPRDVRSIAVARFPPTPHVLTEAVHVGQLFPVLLCKQPALLRLIDPLAPKPVAGRTTPWSPRRFSRFLVVDPVFGRLLVWAAQDGLLHRLHGDLLPLR